MSLLSILFLISLLSLYTNPTLSQTTCKSLQLSQTFANCQDLPTLSAVLHWTYNPSNSSLSIAFTASPPNPDGWVAWGLNPNGTNMLGSQVILAHKPSSSSSVTVKTYNLSSYAGVVAGPISYKVTSLSAQDSSGVITVFGTWALPKGASKLNQVWQVGPMANGNVGKHDFTPANLGSKLELSLTSSGSPGTPATSPKSSPSSPSGAPEASPTRAPEASPMGSPSSPSGAPMASPVEAPGASPMGSPSSPPSAPGASPAGAPETSPTSSPPSPNAPGASPHGTSPMSSPPSPSGASGAPPAGAPPPGSSSPSSASGDTPSSPENSPSPNSGDRLVSGVLALGSMMVYFLF